MIVRPRPPFDLRLTALVLERVRGNRFDRWDGKAYRRLGADGVVTVRAGPEGLVVAGPAEPLALTRLLGLDVDLEGFYELARTDSHLTALVTRLRGLRPQRFPTLWEALCNGVACQQVSLASGLSALGRLAEHLGGSAEGLVRIPGPSAVVDADLGGLGFSRRKQDYLRGLAAAALDGTFEGFESLPTREAYERLVALRGIGRWTAEYVLLRGLGRLEVFPADDVGAARSLSRLLGVTGLDAAAVRRMVDRWGEWKGVVFFYLLGWRRSAEAET